MQQSIRSLDEPCLNKKTGWKIIATNLIVLFTFTMC